MKKKRKIEIREKGADREEIVIRDSEASQLVITDRSNPTPDKWAGGRKRWLIVIVASVMVVVLNAVLWPKSDLIVKSDEVLPLEDLGNFPIASAVPKTRLRAEGWVLPVNMLDLITQENPDSLIPWALVQEIERIASWTIGLRYLSKGDSIVVLRETDGSTSRPIKALSLRLKTADAPLWAFAYDTAGEQARFYDQEGRAWRRRFLRSPVKYGQVSSNYNLIRLHPVLQEIRAHQGTDFAAPEGSPIQSLADGVISRRDSTAGNGNYIEVQHDEVYRSTYLHLSAFVPGLEIGDRVRQGDVIGFVGATGLATGPHVCLRFWMGNEQIDFIRALPFLPKSPLLPLRERTAFREHRDSLLQMMADPVWNKHGSRATLQ